MLHNDLVPWLSLVHYEFNIKRHLRYKICCSTIFNDFARKTIKFLLYFLALLNEPSLNMSIEIIEIPETNLQDMRTNLQSSLNVPFVTKQSKASQKFHSIYIVFFIVRPALRNFYMTLIIHLGWSEYYTINYL